MFQSAREQNIHSVFKIFVGMMNIFQQVFNKTNNKNDYYSTRF